MTKTPSQVSAFTKRYDTIVNVITTQVKISKNDILESENALQVTAIWDTGATNCAITEKVANELGLIPISKIPVQSASEIKLQNVYIINLSLPNNVLLNNVKVTGMADLSNADMLIGMDVINCGDFSISNYNGKSVATFRIPSISDTDYVKALKNQISVKVNKVGRNELCPCGSGKKYKNCCGI